ncbi:MAG: hypothetical protein RIQ92_1186, partial [Actinomycetota bacterium]
MGSDNMSKQQEFVLRTIEERDIRFIRLWFTDVLGTLKSSSMLPLKKESASMDLQSKVLRVTLNQICWQSQILQHFQSCLGAPKHLVQLECSVTSLFYTHPEIEFFLFKSQPEKGEVPTPVDQGGYFDHTPAVVGHDFRRQAITLLEAMGVSVEFSHHEGAPGQQEIDLRYADALSTADNIMT